MVFTTQVFLFMYFPVCILSYIFAEKLELIKPIASFLKKIRLKDLCLIALSIGFYMWSCFDDAYRLLAYIAIVYILALWIQSLSKKKLFFEIKKDDCEKSTSYKRIYISLFALTIAVSVLVFCLAYYKYSDFFARIWNMLFKDVINPKSLIAPIGLSFITFSAISYLTDIYRGKATAGSIIDCTLYITFFPKVVSGPTVLWKDFQPQIRTRKTTLDLSADGLNRIMIGFAKKVLLADTFGTCINSIGTTGFDRVTAAGTLILYMLQIYYDFSGYSDIAIGLAKLFGFEFKENFNFPYRSKSISEFWRRWHISLGTWFREYVYFPLGGSRVSLLKTLRNLAVVFILTGIWHGAGFTYIIWGCLNGLCVIIERVIQDKKFYQKTPNFIKYLVTMTIVMFSWMFFRFSSLAGIKAFVEVLIGTVRFEKIYYTWQYYFDIKMLVFTAVGILGATLLGSPKIAKIYNKVASTKIGYFIFEIVIICLFVLSILFMVNSTYKPFIYFQY